MKFILLIKVKMPTIVGILTLISMINTASERLEARNLFAFRYFSFYEQLKFRAQLSWVEHEKNFITSEPDLSESILGKQLSQRTYKDWLIKNWALLQYKNIKLPIHALAQSKQQVVSM